MESFPLLPQFLVALSSFLLRLPGDHLVFVLTVNSLSSWVTTSTSTRKSHSVDDGPEKTPCRVNVGVDVGVGAEPSVAR